MELDIINYLILATSAPDNPEVLQDISVNLSDIIDAFIERQEELLNGIDTEVIARKIQQGLLPNHNKSIVERKFDSMLLNCDAHHISRMLALDINDLFSSRKALIDEATHQLTEEEIAEMASKIGQDPEDYVEKALQEKMKSTAVSINAIRKELTSIQKKLIRN